MPTPQIVETSRRTTAAHCCTIVEGWPWTAGTRGDDALILFLTGNAQANEAQSADAGKLSSEAQRALVASAVLLVYVVPTKGAVSGREALGLDATLRTMIWFSQLDTDMI
jgi:hypothetical protein